MADAKISALPSASTPLDGTEVLPIVKSGVTDKVTVANLTAGRAVSAMTIATSNVGNNSMNTTYSGNFAVTGGAAKYGTWRFTDEATYSAFINWNNAYLQFTGPGAGTAGMRLDPSGNAGVESGDFTLSAAGKSYKHSTGVLWRVGAGTPEGAITAPVGSIYSRTDGGAVTSFYVKESGVGNTGWVAK